ncbi:Non-structural protein NS-S [Dissostichus eleginoides]|uniref:Non-structural protein NS-S n=1 Tax=Dissostichus eleginoides TaxID=100907 RepID=A0AAD9BSR4_DISEL|nr:Non-structural protein NS-S [Dissostichus eleginoides]
MQKNSLKRERGDHTAVVSNVGPGILAGMNLNGSGHMSFSSLLCHLGSSSVIPPRPRFLGATAFFLCFSLSFSFCTAAPMVHLHQKMQRQAELLLVQMPGVVA